MADPPSLCLVCTKIAKHECGRCHSTKYCSPECQKADWAAHKILCKAYATFDFTTRPSPNHRLAIFFPEDEPKPRFVWLVCRSSGLVDPFLAHFKGGLKNEPGWDFVDTNSALDRKLSDPLLLFYRNYFRPDGSKSSKSILPLVKQPGMQHKDWKGPLLGYVQRVSPEDFVNNKKEERGRSLSRDVNLIDFRHMVDHLRSYSWKVSPDVKGVRINCLGDEKCHGRPPYEAVDVPITHEIFRAHDTSDIAALLEIPILTRREPHSSDWKDAKDHAPFDGCPPHQNLHAAWLHCSTRDDKATGRSWGKIPASWEEGVGSVLVRQDKKPLHKMHLSALAGFRNFEMARRMKYVLNAQPHERPMSKEYAMQHATPPVFCLYWRAVFASLDKMGKEAMRHEERPNGLPLIWDPYVDPLKWQRDYDKAADLLSSMAII